MVYRWKELDLFTIQTLSNIITFLQFALSPLELISSEAKVSDQNLITLLNTRLDSFVHFISAPLDLIRKYNNLIGPIRALLSAVLFNAIIIFLYAIFFLPSWRFLVFFLDIFIPCCFLFGIIFMWRKYETQKRISIIFILSQCCGRKELNIPPKYPNAKNISELFYEGFEKDLLIK